MAKKTYYAIRNTRQIVESWDECKAIVNGMSGAKYKKFFNLDDAKAFINGEVTPIDQQKVLHYSLNGISGTIRCIENTDPFTLGLQGSIFVSDGSFNPKTKIYGGGVAQYDSNANLLGTRRITGTDPNFAESRNVAGEVVAFATAIAMAVEQGLSSITLVCDYEGIVRWSAPKSLILRGLPCWGIEGMHKSSPIASYHSKALEYARGNGLTRIHFIWVRGHSGVHVNNVVDKLAKEAVGVK